MKWPCGNLTLHIIKMHEDSLLLIFNEAIKHAFIMRLLVSSLLSPRHLLMASSQRVLALIVEEIAIDEPNKTVRKKLLARYEDN